MIMTRKINIEGRTVIVLESEGSDVCELCGTTAELRPYGPNNERICFPCGMKDVETTKKKFFEFIGIDPDNLPPHEERTLH